MVYQVSVSSRSYILSYLYFLLLSFNDTTPVSVSSRSYILSYAVTNTDFSGVDDLIVSVSSRSYILSYS